MSYVDSVLLCISCAEDSIEAETSGLELDTYPLVGQINAWLAEREFRPLVDITDHMGGTKHSQMCVFGAAFNYFAPRDEFGAMVISLPWEYPGEVVLLINPEEGATKIVRPKSGAGKYSLYEGFYVLGDIARR